MKFTCPYCGNNSFVVAQNSEGASLATCGKCAKVVPFEKYMMTDSSVSQEAGAKTER